MKIMKKMTALLLALLMVMGMLVTTAVADEPVHTIKIKNDIEGHTYVAYQIFTGDLNTAGVLSNIKWGTGVKAADLVGELTGNNLLTNYPNLKDPLTQANPFASVPAYDNSDPNASADAVAKAIAGMAVDGAQARAFADVVAKHFGTPTTASDCTYSNGIYTITVTAPGFYLVKDKEDAFGNAEGFAHTDYMLMLTGKEPATAKSSVPYLTHLVSNGSTSNYDKATDAEVGAPIYHRLETNIPTYYDNYQQYHVHFKVEIPENMDVSLATQTDVTDHSKVVYKHITFALEYTNPAENIKVNMPVDNEVISMDNGNLVIHLDDLKDRDNINKNSKIVVNFVTGLKGTDTTVTGKGNNDNGNVVNAVLNFSNDPNQPKNTPHDQINFGTISSAVSVYTYQLKVTKLDSGDENKKLEGAEFILFRRLGASLTPYYAIADTNSHWITDWTTEENAATRFTSDTDGVFVINGVDSLAYYLKETTAPSGYDLLPAPESVAIDATFSGQSLATLKCTIERNAVSSTDEDLEQGIAKGNIHNNPGEILPTTGGIGTTIFYIVGGVLVLGAGAAFVMKRRNEEI